MSTVPTNPFYDILRNWQNMATQTIQQWRTRTETVRARWYGRLYGPTPAPAAMIGPLRRLRMQQAGTRLVQPQTRSFVMPHASHPGVEPYDMSYRGPSGGAPVTSKRLGVEGEPFDFTY